MAESATAITDPATATDTAVAQLTTSLARALRHLGDLGEPTTAARIAAEAYSALRRDHAQAAERLNQVMHYLARLEEAGQDGKAATR